jgi:hypothetical protein
MTNDSASYRQLATDRNAPDHLPACPRCGNLCGVMAVICVDCGSRLYLDDDHLPIPRLGREDVQATKGTEA